VASRQEEKERRRQERLERERAEQRAAARRKRLQIVGGGVLAVAAVAAVIVAVVVGAGGGDSAAEQPADAPQASAQIPVQQTSDYQEAAKAAGCTLSNPTYEGAGHQDKEFTATDYETNPPTSGPHTPDWYEDGIYNPGDVPELGKLVHTLEHGRINVQYKPGTPPDTVAQLEALLAEQSEGYHMLLYENTTNMDAAVAATAWTHSLTCPRMNDKVFDAIRTFRARYIDKGPEQVP
jgi:Protein of unknown function (DUF3105)